MSVSLNNTQEQSVNQTLDSDNLNGIAKFYHTLQQRLCLHVKHF